MNPPPWKVGELARRTGLSVRTLHHYDAIGLLPPSHRTESGHRLYAAADAARLQQILSLRQLGFSLDEVRDCLGRPDFSPSRVVHMHLRDLRERVEAERRLCDKLETLARRFGSAAEVSAEDFLQTIEAMNMLEKYYTPEQRDQLQERTSRSAKRKSARPRRSGRISSPRSAPRWKQASIPRASRSGGWRDAPRSWSRRSPAETPGSRSPCGRCGRRRRMSTASTRAR